MKDLFHIVQVRKKTSDVEAQCTNHWVTIRQAYLLAIRFYIAFPVSTIFPRFKRNFLFSVSMLMLYFNEIELKCCQSSFILIHKYDISQSQGKSLWLSWRNSNNTFLMKSSILLNMTLFFPEYLDPIFETHKHSFVYVKTCKYFYLFL